MRITQLIAWITCTILLGTRGSSIHAQQVIDTKQALATIYDTQQQLHSTRQHIYRVDDMAATPDNPDYLTLRAEMINQVQDMLQQLHNVRTDIKRVAHFQLAIQHTKETLQQTQTDQEQTKQHIRDMAQLMHQAHNEFNTSNQAKLDNIKLLVKGPNIAYTSSYQNQFHLLVYQFKKMLIHLEKQEKEQKALLQQLSKQQRSLAKHNKTYQATIQHINQKRHYLDQFLNQYEKDRQIIKVKLQQLMADKNDIQTHIQQTAQNIIANTFYPQGRDRHDRLQNMYQLSPRWWQDNIPLSRPVLPIQSVSATYQDPNFALQHNFAHQGVELLIPHRTPIHAMSEGVIVEISDAMGMGTSRITIAHKNNYLTSYVNLHEILIQPGDIVRQGQVIAYSGKDRLDKHNNDIQHALSIHIVKNGHFVDPFRILDLSVITDNRFIPHALHFKQRNDKQQLPVDVSTAEILPGETVKQRRSNFLKKYAGGIYGTTRMREKAASKHNINPIFLSCIAFAETSFQHFASAHNIGNIGNDDSGNRVLFTDPFQGMQAIADTLDNIHFHKTYTLDELSGRGIHNQGQAVYASSPQNRQVNNQKCLTSILGYPVPYNRAYRNGPVVQVTSSFQAAQEVDYQKATH